MIQGLESYYHCYHNVFGMRSEVEVPAKGAHITLLVTQLFFSSASSGLSCLLHSTGTLLSPGIFGDGRSSLSLSKRLL